MRHMENKPISILHIVRAVCTGVTSADKFMPQAPRMYEMRCTGINHMMKNHTSASNKLLEGLTFIS